MALLVDKGFSAHDGPVGFGEVCSSGDDGLSTLATLDDGYDPFSGTPLARDAQTGLLRLVEREGLAPDDAVRVTVQPARRAHETLPNEPPTAHPTRLSTRSGRRTAATPADRAAGSRRRPA